MKADDDDVMIVELRDDMAGDDGQLSPASNGAALSSAQETVAECTVPAGVSAPVSEPSTSAGMDLSCCSVEKFEKLKNHYKHSVQWFLGMNNNSRYTRCFKHLHDKSNLHVVATQWQKRCRQFITQASKVHDLLHLSLRLEDFSSPSKIVPIWELYESMQKVKNDKGVVNPYNTKLVKHEPGGRSGHLPSNLHRDAMAADDGLNGMCELMLLVSTDSALMPVLHKDLKQCFSLAMEMVFPCLRVRIIDWCNSVLPKLVGEKVYALRKSLELCRDFLLEVQSRKGDVPQSELRECVNKLSQLEVVVTAAFYSVGLPVQFDVLTAQVLSGTPDSLATFVRMMSGKSHGWIHRKLEELKNDVLAVKNELIVFQTDTSADGGKGETETGNAAIFPSLMDYPSPSSPISSDGVEIVFEPGHPKRSSSVSSQVDLPATKEHLSRSDTRSRSPRSPSARRSECSRSPLAISSRSGLRRRSDTHSPRPRSRSRSRRRRSKHSSIQRKRYRNTSRSRSRARSRRRHLRNRRTGRYRRSSRSRSRTRSRSRSRCKRASPDRYQLSSRSRRRSETRKYSRSPTAKRSQNRSGSRPRTIRDESVSVAPGPTPNPDDVPSSLRSFADADNVSKQQTPQTERKRDISDSDPLLRRNLLLKRHELQKLKDRAEENDFSSAITVLSANLDMSFSDSLKLLKTAASAAHDIARDCLRMRERVAEADKELARERDRYVTAIEAKRSVRRLQVAELVKEKNLLRRQLAVLQEMWHTGRCRQELHLSNDLKNVSELFATHVEKHPAKNIQPPVPREEVSDVDADILHVLLQNTLEKALCQRQSNGPDKGHLMKLVVRVLQEARELRSSRDKMSVVLPQVYSLLEEKEKRIEQLRRDIADSVRDSVRD